MTGGWAKAIILVGGGGVLAHQFWLQLQLRAARRERNITAAAPYTRPHTWQQALSGLAITLGLLLVGLIVLDIGWLDGPDGYGVAYARWAGILLFLGGIGIRFWALASLGIAYTPELRVDSHQSLVTTGAYTWVRHPFYLSAVLMLFGAGLALWNGLFLGLNLLLWLVLCQRIRLEENMLVAVFGETYIRYRAKTPALLPFVARKSGRNPCFTPGE